MKKFFGNIWHAFRDAAIRRVTDGTGIEHTKYGICTILIVAIVIVFLGFVVLGFGESIKDHVKNLTDKSLAAANAALFQKDLSPDEDSMGLGVCKLDDGQWFVWNGSAIRDSGGYSLPPDSPRVLFQYDQTLEKNSSYSVAFAPKGDVSNFSVLVPDSYEVVIGDGDYQSISFKASVTLGAPPTTQIKEEVTGLEHPMLSYRIKKGTEVDTNVEETEINGRLRIGIDVIYVPDIADNPERWKDHYEFEFTPASPELRSHRLVIGIFRVKVADGKQVQVQFICPRNP